MQAENNIHFNLPQMITAVAPQKHIYAEWGRGTGKSTILAWRIKNLAYQMPRAKFFIVGQTYMQILTRTLPSTIAGLELLGYYKDVHFWIGRKPPKKLKIPEPFQPPLNYEHTLYWHTGAVFDLISMDNKNGGRGLNTDGGVGDEAALLQYEALFNNVLSTNRGHLDRFGNCPLHHSTMFTSSTPVTQVGKWLIKMEEEAKRDPEKILYLRASSEFNRHNLGDDWFRENKRILPKLIYSAEIDNVRHEKIDGGFYANFDEERHTYLNYNNGFLESLDYNFSKLLQVDCRMDSDTNPYKPISVAFDYGASINTMICEQDFGRTSRYINSFFVLSPGLVTECVKQFCKYYHYHSKKVVDYYYDHTAVFRTAINENTFADVVIKAFDDEGWEVIPHYIGQAPAHNDKYLLWNRIFLGLDPSLPEVEFNADKCKYPILSMQLAPVKQGKDGFEKDKSSERRDGAQEEATHFSDAVDTLMYGKYAVGKVGHML